MDAHEILEALEGWSLQTLLDASILLGFFALGLALLGDYARALRERLSLRVSAELLDLGLVVGVDLLLALKVGLGFLLLNPDVMEDIKVAVPFMPVATVLFAVALVLRLFRGGHRAGSGSHRAALWLLALAVLLEGLSYSLVLEGPGHELLELRPSPAWEWVRENLRSNGGPGGRLLGWYSFLATYPLLLATFLWGLWSGLRASGSKERP